MTIETLQNKLSKAVAPRIAHVLKSGTTAIIKIELLNNAILAGFYKMNFKNNGVDKEFDFESIAAQCKSEEAKNDSECGYILKDSKFVGHGAFNGSKIKRIEIPEGIEEIHSRSFIDCERLCEVVIPNTVTTISGIGGSGGAFENCISLRSISIPSSVTRILESAFNGCISLEEVQLSERIAQIGNNAFSDCVALKEIHLPDNLSEMGNYVFRGCSSLRSVNIPRAMTRISAGTFLTWNCVQLIITPNRDFAVFFPFLFSFVLGSVQLVNLVTGYSIYYFDWEAMHFITIMAFLTVGIIVAFCMRRHYRNGLYIPFKGMDYLGGILWTLLLFCIVFVFVYGDYYDWLDAPEIQTALLFAAILLFMCLHRAGRIRHPYISHATFSQRNMLFIFLLFGGMTLMSATNTSTQNVFTGRILGFDSRYQADLNWGLMAGIVMGTVFFFLSIKKWKLRVKMVVLCGFLFFLAYQVMMYFLIDASTESYMLQLPSLCKGAGVGLVYTSLTFALAGSTTFEYYFQAMCVIGFIRTSFGAPLSSAIFGRAYKRMFAENSAGLGWELDGTAFSQVDMLSIAAEFQRQLTMVTLKEVYGLAALAAIVIILLILASDFRHPIIKTSNHLLKKSQAWVLTKRSLAKPN